MSLSRLIRESVPSNLAARGLVHLVLAAGVLTSCGGGGDDPAPASPGTGGRGGSGSGGRSGPGNTGGSPGSGGSSAAGGTGGAVPTAGAGGSGSGGSTGNTGSGGTTGRGGSGGAPSDAGRPAEAGAPDSSGGTEAGTPAPGPTNLEGWTLRWSGEGSGAGLNMFEGQETADCAHGGGTHASVAEGNIRIDMHTNDTDCNGRADRARNEVKGMRAAVGDGYVAMKRGETWLLTYSMFIPSSLNATSAFSHIFQVFSAQGTSAVTGPVITMSLHQHAGVDSIELRIDGNSGPHTGASPLAPIQNKWVTVEFEVKWDNPGTMRWTIKDDKQVYANVSRAWNGWHGAERMRPKWGIYRSKGSAGLQNTYLLLNNFKAYQK